MNILSLEEVAVLVTAKKLGLSYDPTGDEVQIAFKPRGKAPGVSDWNTATWETDTVGTKTQYVAKILVGPGGAVTLAAGTWVVWIRITDNPEIPVLQVGVLTIDNV